jgi:hypothetical protein
LQRLCAYFRGHESVAAALGIFDSSGPLLFADTARLAVSFLATHSPDDLWTTVTELIGSPRCPEDFHGVFVKLNLSAKQDLELMGTLLSLGFVMHECRVANQPTMAFNFTTTGSAWRRATRPLDLPPSPNVKVVSKAVIFNKATNTFHVPASGMLMGIKAPREPPNFLCDKVCAFTKSKCAYEGTICQVWDAFDDSITNLDLYTFANPIADCCACDAVQMAGVIERQCGHVPAEQFVELLQARKSPAKYRSANGAFVLMPKGV